MSDEELMAAFYACDAAALDQLMQRWQARLHRYLTRFCGSFHRAEDYLQETFLRVFRTKAGNTARYRPPAPFAPWIYRIAFNVAVSGQRSPQNRFPVVSSDVDVAQERPASAATQLESDLMECLQTLNEQERTVVTLAFLDEQLLTQTEIAEVLGLSNSRVSAIKTSALEKLRTCMEQREYR